METTHPIFTIGYEGAAVEPFLRALRDHGVKTVIDVRAVPLSRKAGFSKNKLAGHLSAAGIAYAGLKGLGTPAEGRAAARRGNVGELRRIFEAHLLTEDARRDLAESIRIAKETPSCLLCFEHAPECCHRAIVADHIVRETGQEIVHIDVKLGEII